MWLRAAEVFRGGGNEPVLASRFRLKLIVLFSVSKYRESYILLFNYSCSKKNKKFLINLGAALLNLYFNNICLS